ncbi:MAG: ribonuclease E [Agarilytica sp.]
MLIRALVKLFHIICDSIAYFFCDVLWPKLKTYRRFFWYGLDALVITMVVVLCIGKIYQNWDDDPERGAIPIASGEFDENYETPIYLDQGWSESDSLWFYNTTQGSNLLPYDFYLALELPDSDQKFNSTEIYDKYRYLPQKETFFNPDALAVGFTKDDYQGKDYLGYTCAACHTGQVNYQGKAIRIDGGPAMADMVGFLYLLQKSMQTALEDSDKQTRFVEAVLAQNNDYSNKDQVLSDLKKWTQVVLNYNTTNHSSVDYGYARLDAFGRIFNRVLQHVINKNQAKALMLSATKPNGERILTKAQVELVLEGVNETIIGNEQFGMVIDRLTSKEEGYPGLNIKQMLRLRNYLFNEPNAPVSYPFLWGITHSDFVQWNGIAGNATVGPLGRNAGEVTGVFATLDWQMNEKDFNLGAFISGQDNKKTQIDFKSSIDLTNLERLEDHLGSLTSPVWPEDILGKIDQDKAEKGELIYAEYCQSCHVVVDRTNWNRIVTAHMSSLDDIQTDPAMAENSVLYKGKSGNFKNTYQGTDVGTIIMGEEAPVAAILTATTRGVVATPDADKWAIRRWLDWLYIITSSLFDNDIKSSIKAGTYEPDTTASPFQSLLAYKARSLNGIWATAPYLHNGSVPSLYDLLLPAKREGDAEDGEYRPERFMVGSRELDPVKVGFKTEGYEGFEYITASFEGDEISARRGNSNRGHEYAAGRTPQPNGEILPPLNEEQRWQLLEYMKTL